MNGGTAVGGAGPGWGRGTSRGRRRRAFGQLFRDLQDRSRDGRRISARRGLANSFFLTINTTVLGILGAVKASWYLAIAGIILCVSWWALLKSYRDLNRAKFEVILAMEQKLPARLYGDEWNYLRREHVRLALNPAAIRAWFRYYRELGVVERTVPWVFVLVYVAEVVRQLVR